MSKNTKLELTWIGKENRPKLEPRILIEDPDKSHLAARRVTDSDLFDNRLIHGDNLLALKALEQEYCNAVQCVYIDIPFNTGQAFQHYDDGVEHSLWLSLIRDRLELLRQVLSPSGSIWVHCDDNEHAYLKVLMDEIFGRANFLANVCWEKVYTLKNSAKHFSSMHDFILVYAKDIDRVRLSLLPRGEKQNAGFKNPDDDPRGPWIDSAMHGRNYYSKGTYTVTSPSGKAFTPPPGRYWTVSFENFNRLDSENRIWWGKDGNNAPRKKTFIDEVRGGVIPGTIWSHEEAGQNAEAKDEIKRLFPEANEVFITPKPERLIQRILTIATLPGELVLDSFAGTGTTGAVAHKMRRRWLMVELGDHAETHILPRLRKVVDGDDSGGVTESVNWKGGGGFRYYRLAPSLLERDQWGNWVISKQFNSAMLAEAVCKLEGFTYAPSQDHYWEHGHSTERDYIYVTTQKLTHQQLHALSEEVGPERSLLVCCAAFRGSADQWPNLTLKKIPKAVMERCEWGRDDYSLSISNLPAAESLDVNGDAESPTAKKKAGPKKAKVAGQADLFGGEGEEA
ncbi:MAG: site-specific DNA-methyltransferase [Acidobacteria bacterium]|nr:site-specific DNA-methyltransferase [Acidobacteriota bacterium]